MIDLSNINFDVNVCQFGLDPRILFSVADSVTINEEFISMTNFRH